MDTLGTRQCVHIRGEDLEDFKNPIFILHEITKLQNKPKPAYKVSRYANGYNCHCKIDEIQVTSFNTQVYPAQRHCAKRVLGFLKFYANSERYACPPGYNTNDVQEVPNFDTVTLLNKICATTKKEDAPMYTELEPVQGIFGIKCALSLYITRGFAKTKEEAKRVAARKMLEEILNLPEREVTMSEKELTDTFKNFCLNPDEFDDPLTPYEIFRRQSHTSNTSCTIM